MKQEITGLIEEVVNLLVDSDWTKQAIWFENILSRLKNAPESGEEFQKIIKELDASLSGIGSFSDLPLKSKSGKFSNQELRVKQWEIVETIGSLIKQ